jgi:hypothetical protein
MVVNNVKSDGLKTLYFIIAVAFLVFVVGGFLGTAGGGFSDADFKERYSLYFIFGLSSLLIFGLIALTNFISGKQVIFLPVHDPEDSLVGNSSLWVRSPILFSLVSLILAFIFAFYFAFFKNTFFSSVPQSISSVSTVWSQSIFPLVENPFFFLLVPLVLLFVNRRLFFKDSRALYWGLNLVVIPLISAFMWVIFHNLVYSGSESAQLSTFIFGFLWVMVTMLFMSQIIGLALHFAVNFAVALRINGELGSDSVKVGIIAFVVFLIIVAIWYYRYASKSKSGVRS